MFRLRGAADSRGRGDNVGKSVWERGKGIVAEGLGENVRVCGYSMPVLFSLLDAIRETLVFHNTRSTLTISFVNVLSCYQSCSRGNIWARRIKKKRKIVNTHLRRVRERIAQFFGALVATKSVYFFSYLVLVSFLWKKKTGIVRQDLDHFGVAARPRTACVCVCVCSLSLFSLSLSCFRC